MQSRSLVIALGPHQCGATTIQTGLFFIEFAVAILVMGWMTWRHYQQRYTYSGSTSDLWYGVPEPRDDPEPGLEMPRWSRRIILTAAALSAMAGLITTVAGLLNL